MLVLVSSWSVSLTNPRSLPLSLSVGCAHFGDISRLEAGGQRRVLCQELREPSQAQASDRDMGCSRYRALLVCVCVFVPLL